MATKEHKRQAKELISTLESRVHAGPPICATEISSARDFLRQSDFSPASDYFNRLTQIEGRIDSRVTETRAIPGKRNYGGEAAGRWLQLQSAYDHIIISTCYEGEFNSRRGRVKLSHRFNGEGRVDFVELKFLRSLEPSLNGAIRKLLMIKDFSQLRKEWQEAEAFVLPVLPKELIFLYDQVFRCEKPELFSWLTNIGHWLVAEFLNDLEAQRSHPPTSASEQNPTQLPLSAIRSDPVATPILEKAAGLESAVEVMDARTVLVRYHTV